MLSGFVCRGGDMDFFKSGSNTFLDASEWPGFEAECEPWISACNNTGLVGRA